MTFFGSEQPLKLFRKKKMDKEKKEKKKKKEANSALHFVMLRTEVVHIS